MSVTTTSLRGRILTSTGWIFGDLLFNQRVLRFSETKQDKCELKDWPMILPGFIDLHVHGGLNTDIMQGGRSAEIVAQIHARHGTTAMLGTTMTASQVDIEIALQGLAQVMAKPATNAARILGAHLEGPFLSPNRLGAQPPTVLEGTLDLVQLFNAIAPIRVITLAPEVGAHLDLISKLTALGIRVQIGHSAGSYDEGVAAIRAGVSSFTHLFNGMTGLNHYQPGMVGAALAHSEYAELIPDLQHVHEGAIRVALRAIPKLYCVTDATAATGMPDGEYPLGSQKVFKCLGCVRLANGSLAGSALTMDQALRNLVSLGLSISDASNRLSKFPAEYLGINDRGTITPGSWADIVVLNQDLKVTQVFLEGHMLDLAKR